MPFYLLVVLFVTVIILLWAMSWRNGIEDTESVAWMLCIVMWCVLMFPYVKAAW